MKTLTNGRIITDGRILDGYDIITDGGKITAVVPHGTPQGETVDLNGRYISAGFIDLHCHGGGGAEFIDAEPEAFRTAAAVHAKHGTRILFPTVSATDFDTMVRVLECFRTVRKSCALEMPGVHLEGPYLALEMCGGQAPEIIRPIDPKEYNFILKNYGDLIARWSYAPEKDPDNTFAEALKAHGIVSATAHSSAEYEDICRALQADNRLITHLYSCTSTVTRRQGFRHLGIIESAFLLDELFVETIADGRHLPPELLKMIVKIKGAGRVAMITDALRPGGAGPEQEGKTYTDCPVPFIIEDGVAKLLDRSAFAGSIATTDTLMKTAVGAGITLTDAVKMLTETPAYIMHLAEKGRIAPGFDAQFTIFDDTLQIMDIKL